MTAIFTDDEGLPAEPDDATLVEIDELDDEGNESHTILIPEAS